MTVRLSRRIILGTAISTSAVVLVAALAVWWGARTVMYQGIDANLQNSVRRLIEMPAQVPSPPSAPQRRPPTGHEALPGWRHNHGQATLPWFVPSLFASRAGVDYFQYLDSETGAELYHSPNLAEEASLAPHFAQITDGGIRSIELADGRWIRAIKVRVTYAGLFALPPWAEMPAEDDITDPGTHRPIDAIMGLDASSVRRELTLLAWGLASLWGLATTLSALAAIWLRRAVLHPIERISDIIADIDPDRLQTRVPLGDVPEEMRVILARLDALVERLDRAFARERTTIANIAHELRTPLSGIRTTLEFALARGPHASRDDDLQACLQMSEAMQRMMANLLMLARLESGRQPLSLVPVDLPAVIADSLASVRTHAGGITVQVEPGLRLLAHADHLRMVISNVLENAVHHGLPATAIELRGRRHEAWIVIEVVNATDGTMKDVNEVFSPFWRAETARTAGHHCGLGLALVQRLVVVFGGTVDARLDEQRRFHLTIRLPALVEQVP
jgi:signal transduction histidine kinase